MLIKKQEEEYNLLNWWKKAFYDNYAIFKGRSRRKEFWYFFLGNSILLIATFIGVGLSSDLEDGESIFFDISLALFLIIWLLLFIPFLAASSRRLHDTGKSGWWTLLCFIPYVSYIGWIVLIFFWAGDSENGKNQYGPNPKGSIDSEIDQIGTE